MTRIPRFIRARVKADHLAQKWNRTPEKLDTQLQKSQAWADIIGLTEVANDRRARRMYDSGWTVCRDDDGSKGECALLFRDSVWEVIDWETYVLGPDLGPGAEIIGVVAAARNKKTGAVVVVSEAHMPSAVEGNFLTRARRPVEYRKALQRYRKIVLQWRRMHKPNGVMVFADWNLNAFRAWVRRFIRRAWPGLRLSANLPKRGTHGGRFIDWVLTRGIRYVTMRVWQDDPASDHRGLRVTGWVRTRNPAFA